MRLEPETTSHSRAISAVCRPPSAGSSSSSAESISRPNSLRPKRRSFHPDRKPGSSNQPSFHPAAIPVGTNRPLVRPDGIPAPPAKRRFGLPGGSADPNDAFLPPAEPSGSPGKPSFHPDRHPVPVKKRQFWPAEALSHRNRRKRTHRTQKTPHSENLQPATFNL